MARLTFNATVNHGTIKIPRNLHDQIQGDVLVSVTVNDTVRGEAKNFLREMIENPIVDPGFVPLTREEIYDRT